MHVLANGSNWKTLSEQQKNVVQERRENCFLKFDPVETSTPAQLGEEKIIVL